MGNKKYFFFLDVPASGAYFATYEGLQRAMKKDDGELSLVATICAGGCAGIANWLIGMPPDVLKSRLQTGNAYKFFIKIYLLEKNFIVTVHNFDLFFYSFNILKYLNFLQLQKVSLKTV